MASPLCKNVTLTSSGVGPVFQPILHRLETRIMASQVIQQERGRPSGVHAYMVFSELTPGVRRWFKQKCCPLHLPLRTELGPQ